MHANSSMTWHDQCARLSCWPSCAHHDPHIAHDCLTCCHMQDVPTRDVAPCYLASLPTTEAVLATLGAAHRARLAIAAGKTVKPHLVRLAAPPGAPALDWAATACVGIAFSACGQYLAVSFQWTEEVQRPRKLLPRLNGVMLFSVWGGIKQRHCVCGYYDAPVFCWAPDAPHLSIAEALDLRARQPAAEHPAVLVIDALTGSVLHALGPRNQDAFHALHQSAEPFSNLSLEWSPSGRYLLVGGHADVSMPDPAAGLEPYQLSVFDVWEDRLVAQSACALQLTRWSMLPATWHPSSSSPGLVLSSRTFLSSPAAFTAAGFALGTLPDRCYIPGWSGTGFSADQQRFLAHGDSGGSEPEARPEDNDLALPQLNGNVRVLRCVLAGRQISFEPEFEFEGYACQWLPCSFQVVAGASALGETPERPQIGSLHDPHHGIKWEFDVQGEEFGLKPLAFSPSRQLMLEMSKAPQLICLESGKQLWAADYFDAMHKYARSGKYVTLDDVGLMSLRVAFSPSGSGQSMCAADLVKADCQEHR